MKTIDLNIGLARKGTFNLEPTTVQRMLIEHDLLILSARIEQSSTEPTLVCRCVNTLDGANDWDMQDRIHWLAGHLGQDCIAWVDDSGTGHLTGPNAAGWGDFNPAYFIPVVPVATREHVEFLRHTLIPDLRESGDDATAEDFESCVTMIEQAYGE